MRRYMTYALLSVLFAMVACSEPITKEMVVGEYVANYKVATDNIEVRSDGTYRHYHTEPDGEEFINEGRWELELVNGEFAITFSNFKSKVPGRQHKGEGGYYPAFIERSSFGRIRLSIDPDLSYYYEKTNSQED